MRQKTIAIMVALGLCLSAGAAWATPNFVTTRLHTPGVEKTLLLPAAADHSPVISLGPAVDPVSGKMVEGYAIIHYKDNQAKPSGPGSKPVACYGFLAKGAKWKAVEPWAVNPANGSGLDGNFVFTNLTGDIANWEDAADGTADGSSVIDILGNGTQTADVLTADTASPDGKNEVYFGSISDSNTIAVTIVWGVFGGSAANRVLVEWDQVYNNAYAWSADGAAGKMDFGNIATHELGHSVGLNDQYNTVCSAVTMYGYAGYGETNKQSLEAPDITGVSTLY
ncbi:MAG: hypothetical protein PHI63_01750 [Patescibacteria group bacterium]|nr:hypothetical protein [Patescibacteria group bacterium]